jgi:anti-sigma-K factor RskA
MTCDDVRDLAAGFVLDALTPGEMAAVREHLATCPEAHEEIAEMAAALPVLAQNAPVVEPPAALGARIRAAAEADLAARTDRAASGATVTAFPTEAERETARARRGASAGTWLLRIAAVVAIALLGGWNLLLQNQVSTAEAYEQSVAAVIDAAGEPGALTAVLTAEGAAGPSGLAAVSPSGDVTLAMQALPATAGSQVYEAWVIGGDGVPVALGSFQVGNAGTASFESTGLPTEPGIVLALTLEPGPGATTPTLPIVSAGTAG